MKQGLFVTLLLLGLGAALGLWLLHDPGYVLVSRGLTSVEMTLWVGIAAWLVSLLLAMAAVETLVRVLGFNGWWSRWTRQRHLQRSARALQDGTVAFEKGEWRRAERLLFSAARLSPEPLPAWLAAARAAMRGDAMDRAEQYLVLAEERGNRLAVGLARARLLVAAGRWEQAAALLARLQDRHRKDDGVLRLRIDVLTRLQKWGELAELLPQLRRGKDRDSRYEALERRACREVLAWVGQAASRADRGHTLARLQAFRDSLPRHLRQDEDVRVAYATQLIRIGADDEAEAELAALLDKDWSPAAIEAYGRTRSTRPDQALARARGWEAAHPHHPALLLALGRLSLQNRQWEAARHYFEATLALGKSAEASAELVRLLARLDLKAAEQRLLESVEAAGQRLPDLPLP